MLVKQRLDSCPIFGVDGHSMLKCLALKPKFQQTPRPRITTILSPGLSLSQEVNHEERSRLV